MFAALVVPVLGLGTQTGVGARTTGATLLGQPFGISPLHYSFGVRVDGVKLADLLETDAAQLRTDINELLQEHKMVVFSDQEEVDPRMHEAICRALGGGGDCLDEAFTQNHNEGLDNDEAGHVELDTSGQERPVSDAYVRLPNAVWPISNDPTQGTVNAGDGGFHCDGAWFGQHFRFMSFFCRAQLTRGGGETLFVSSNEYLSQLSTERFDFLKSLAIEYTDLMVYPGGNSINPSGRKTIIPLVSALEQLTHPIPTKSCGNDIDADLTISAFLDPKYWRRVYISDALCNTNPDARAKLLREPFWAELIGDSSESRLAGKTTEEISNDVVSELSRDEAAKILESINADLSPGGEYNEQVTLPMMWRSGDFGLYCNRRLLHRASASTQSREVVEGGLRDLRLMHRVSIKGPGTPHFFEEGNGHASGHAEFQA